MNNNGEINMNLKDFVIQFCKSSGLVGKYVIVLNYLNEIPDMTDEKKIELLNEINDNEEIKKQFIDYTSVAYHKKYFPNKTWLEIYAMMVKNKNNPSDEKIECTSVSEKYDKLIKKIDEKIDELKSIEKDKKETDNDINNIAATSLKIPVEEVVKNSKPIPEINATYFWEPVRGGKAVIIDSNGEKLIADSSISFDKHLEEFKNGKRN